MELLRVALCKLGRGGSVRFIVQYFDVVLVAFSIWRSFGQFFGCPMEVFRVVSCKSISVKYFDVVLVLFFCTLFGGCSGSIFVHYLEVFRVFSP